VRNTYGEIQHVDKIHIALGSMMFLAAPRSPTRLIAQSGSWSTKRESPRSSKRQLTTSPTASRWTASPAPVYLAGRRHVKPDSTVTR